MTSNHVVIWLDHREAKVIGFSADATQRTVVRHHGGHRQIHLLAGSVGAGHSAGDAQFFDEIVGAAGEATEVLVTGPGQAKVEFRRHVDSRHPLFAKRVLGVESLDHPSEGQLLAFARQYFLKIDQMLGLPRG